MNPEILNYNAKMALEDSKRVDVGELTEILTNIQIEASQGKNNLWIYKPLTSNIITELEKRGFKIESQPSIAIQREGIYYQIKWG